MAVNTRKGFVYTLEAVIASTIVLGMALVVLPETFTDPEPDFQTVETGLKSLDDRNQLDDSPENITEDIESYVPSGYNVSTRITELNSTSDHVTGGESYELGSGYKELLLWIDSANNLEISYRGSTVLNSDETGYRELSLDSRSGYLNFSGTTDLDFRVNRYTSRGSFPDTDSLYSTTYIDSRENDREIQVVIWR